MKNLLLALLFVLAVTATPARAAGIPVVDGSHINQSIMNHIQQMLEMANQLTAMQNQIQNQVRQYEALAGDRGMGSLLNGQVKNYIPDSWKSAIDVLNQPSGYSTLSSSVKSLMDSNKVITDSDLSKMGADTRSFLEQKRQYAATLQALNGAGYDNASTRFQALQTLVNYIGSATDPKAILDLNARIGAEQNSLVNEANKLQAMSETLKAQGEIIDVKRREQIANSGGYFNR